MKHWRQLKRFFSVMETPLVFDARAPMTRVGTTGAWDKGGWFRTMIVRSALEHERFRVKPDQSRWFRCRQGHRSRAWRKGEDRCRQRRGMWW